MLIHIRLLHLQQCLLPVIRILARILFKRIIIHVVSTVSMIYFYVALVWFDDSLHLHELYITVKLNEMKLNLRALSVARIRMPCTQNLPLLHFY